MKQKVLITGGNGFIGSHLVRTFLDGNYDVTCLVRPNSSLENIKNLPVRFVYADITCADTLKNAFHNVDLVIHNAGLSTDWAPRVEFYSVNVEGTKNVLLGCVESDIQHVIFTGSISSYGEEHNTHQKTETNPFNSHYPYFLDGMIPCKMNYYRDSKAEATQIAMQIASQHNLNLTIMEPAFVYGEREFNTGFYEFVKSASNGMFIAPGSKTNYFPVVYAGDLAMAYLSAAEKRLPGVERFIISNGTNEFMSTIFQKFCHYAGVKTPFLISKHIFYFIGICMEILYEMFHVTSAPLLTRGRVNMFVDSLRFSSAKAQRLLNFRSETSLDEGIQKTVQWYKQKGYL